MASGVLSVMLGALLLSFPNALGGSRRFGSDQFTILDTSDGYRCIEDADRPEASVGQIVGDGHVIYWREEHSYFGVFTVVQRPTPTAHLRIDPGHAPTREQYQSLFNSARELFPRLVSPTIDEISPDGDGFVSFRFQPGPWSVVWGGIVSNIAFWAYFLLVCSCIAWFVSALHRLCDPRRKRALRLVAGVCPGCKYDLRMTTSGRCPECGDVLTVEPGRA